MKSTLYVKEKWIRKIRGNSTWETIFAVERTNKCYVVKLGKKKIVSFFYTCGDYFLTIYPTIYTSDYVKALDEACSFLFARYLGVTKICVSILSEDDYGKSIFERVGFVREFILMDHLWYKDKVHSIAVYSLFREEFI